MDVAALPFNRWLGLRVDEQTVRLTPTAQHLNHVATVHAAVLFGVAEAAAGHWLATSFPDLASESIAILRSTSTKYRRPASAELELVGQVISADDVAEFLTAFRQRGRALLEVQAEVQQNNDCVFRGRFSWFVTTK